METWEVRIANPESLIFWREGSASQSIDLGPTALRLKRTEVEEGDGGWQ